MAAATCTTPATCKSCGHIEGYALTHSWVDSEIQGKKECTVCGELLLPDFEFVTRVYGTLAETGFDVEQMLSIFPGVIETKYENGKYMIKDIGAFGAEYFNTIDYSRTPMTLEDGYWTIEISREEYDAVIEAVENFCVDFYSEDWFWQIVYRNGRISDALQIATPGNIYIAMMQTGWDVVDFAYPIFGRHYRDSYELGVLREQQVSFWGDDYQMTAYYFPDGTLNYVSLYIYSEGKFYNYVSGFGWATNPSGDPEYACDAPAGYEDKDADFFTALVPTVINCAHEDGYAAADCQNPERCLVCGIAKEGSEALGHDIVILEAVEPTCIETGLTEGSYCSRCDEMILEQHEIPSMGHEYHARWIDPTCTEAGGIEDFCLNCCFAVRDPAEQTPALGHDYVDGICTRCNETESETENDESESEIETTAETEVETEIETMVETEVEIEIETMVETEVETEIETMVETEVETEIETTVETEDETKAQTETKAPETQGTDNNGNSNDNQSDSENNSDKKSGCGSSIGFGIVAIVTVFCAVFVFRKKIEE